MDLAKYKPKQLRDFLGNRLLIKTLKEGIRKVPCHVLLIGPSGGGKSTLCDLLIDTSRDIYDVLKINGDEYDDLKKLKSLINNFVANKTIESYFTQKKKLVFIDDLDILLSSERNAGSFITAFVEDAIKSGTMSFILTCSNSEEKRLTELKKKISYQRLMPPSSQDVFVYISNILDAEEYEYDHTKLLKLIEVYNNNVRNILNNLHKLDNTCDQLDEEKKKTLFFDSTAFDVMRILLKKKLGYTEITLVSDSHLVPLLLYENYLPELFKNKVKQSKKEYMDMIINITNGMIEGECIEQYMYLNTDWSMYDLSTYLKCIPINAYVNSIDSKKTTLYDKYIFTQLLTKSALRFNYSKKLKELKSKLNITETDNVFYYMDCLAKECEVNIDSHKSGKKKYCTELGIDSENMATICQYFSQFLIMDKPTLGKIKKLC